MYVNIYYVIIVDFRPAGERVDYLINAARKIWLFRGKVRSLAQAPI